MIDCNSFILRSVKPEDYSFILNWYKSARAISGFMNPGFELYDLEKIREMYDEENEDHLTFVVQSKKGMPMGMIMITIEWKDRNAIIDIIMGGSSSSGLSAGSRALQEVTLYCKNELNLRRIEIKISERNKTMMKLFKFFPKDEKNLIDIFVGKKDYGKDIQKYYKISASVYEEKKVEYQTKYIKDVLYKQPKHELTLYDAAVFNGAYTNFHVNSFLIATSEEELSDLFLLASGNLTKSKKYRDG